jgi:CHAD domain-containing protein
MRKVAFMDASHRGDENRQMTAEEIVRQLLGNEVGNLLRNDPGARERRDPEGVHQLRVSARRLRTELVVVASVFDQAALRHLLSELRWLGRALGKPRDLDIRITMLDHVQGDMPPWLARTLAQRLELQKADEIVHVQRLLASDRYRHLITTLTDAVVRPPLSGHAQVPAFDMLHTGLGDALATLAAKVEASGPRPAYEQLHEIRILAKKGRYSAAIAATLLGEQAKIIANSLEQVQNILGELHDRVVVLHYLNEEFDSILIEQPSADLGKSRASVERKLEREIGRLNLQWRQPCGEARRHGTALLGR